MAVLVYKLTCTVTDKSYVGITSRALHTRWLEHCARARQGQRESRLYDAMRKYGLDAWTREVIGTADTDDEARLYERTMIEALGTYIDGYNANEGGHGWTGPMPETSKQKSREKQLGKVMSAESRAKMSVAKKGRSECADHFGDFTKKGAGNPSSATYVIRSPNGAEEAVTGLRAFCRRTGAHWQTLLRGQKSKGYAIVRQPSPPSADALHLKEI